MRSLATPAGPLTAATTAIRLSLRDLVLPGLDIANFDRITLELLREAHTIADAKKGIRPGNGPTFRVSRCAKQIAPQPLTVIQNQRIDFGDVPTTKKRFG